MTGKTRAFPCGTADSISNACVMALLLVFDFSDLPWCGVVASRAPLPYDRIPENLVDRVRRRHRVLASARRAEPGADGHQADRLRHPFQSREHIDERHAGD